MTNGSYFRELRFARNLGSGCAVVLSSGPGQRLGQFLLYQIVGLDARSN